MLGKCIYTLCLKLLTNFLCAVIVFENELSPSVNRPSCLQCSPQRPSFSLKPVQLGITAESHRLLGSSGWPMMKSFVHFFSHIQIFIYLLIGFFKTVFLSVTVLAVL